MAASMTQHEFVEKWRRAQVKERSGYQEHFIDLCRMLGHATPLEEDPSGERFAFEAGAAKQGGGSGWADVWKRGYFAIEYKGKHANLDKAYQQLLQYRESLLNPPLLIVSDMETIEIHTNFTNTAKQTYTLTLDDLLTQDGLATLRRAFYEPEALRTAQTTAQVTAKAAQEFARLAELLRKYGADPQKAAHFLIRLLFCMFAEDTALLPAGVFSRLIAQTRRRTAAFTQQLSTLFDAMREGGWYGNDEILYFNGRLFDNAEVLELDSEGLDILQRVSELDWSAIEPAILGTLFERSLDPSKRSQLGAHYTSREDILLIVEPVLMAPLRRRWAEVQEQARQLVVKRDATKKSPVKINSELQALLVAFQMEIAQTRVLDPACGSGNFLYVALKQLLDLEKEVRLFMTEMGLTMTAAQVGPEQLYGIEINEYAHELAQITVWIGYIQWLRDNGFGRPSTPILKPLDTIRRMDAILAFDEDGQPVEPEWPKAEVVIGNPPFLGDKKMRSELGDQYVEYIRALYSDRVPGGADLVLYWHERSRMLIQANLVHRAGLISTNSIRGGVNRKVIDRMKETGDIFAAWSDRPWVVDGAAVRVSIVCFDNGQEKNKSLNGIEVKSIHADLTAASDLTIAKRLTENRGIAFIGDMKKGSFDIPSEVAERLLAAAGNPNGRPNRDVIRPWVNGLDITRRNRSMWIIDFGIDMSQGEAALYEKPFEYLLQNVKPERDKVRNPLERQRWWLHARPAPDLRSAIAGISRYIGTPRVSKHRVFVYIPQSTLPDGQVVVIAREDDYFFGVLHSRLHTLWTLAMCTWLGMGNDPRYTPTTTFETYPFPWPPGQEPQEDPRVVAIAEAARELVLRRDRWLNPEDVTEAELKKRTLTNLYNQRPSWLDNAHKALDKAVLDAYGWPHDLTDDEILERLLALNLQRATAQGAAPSAPLPADETA